MTVRGKSAGDSIQSNVDRDILFKLLWQKPTGKSRRAEVVHSAGGSFPSHISKKLLLEEHKLNIQLEQIEKERKLFLNRNSNEKHLLELSVRTAKTSENRRSRRQYLVMSENTRCHSSASDHCSLKEGNELFRKSWTSTTNGVFYPSGAKSVRQLQIKKVCLLKKMAERHRMTNSLPWKRNFDMPQVPPPSRSPSKTNIIWVRVRNSSGEMEIDGFLRTNKDFDELLPGNKNNIVPTKIEVRVPREQDRVHNNPITKDKSTLITKIQDEKLSMKKNTALEKSCEDNGSVESLDTGIGQCLKQSSMEQKAGSTDQEATQASFIHSEVLIEQLAPTVKGLKVSPNEIRRSSPVKQKSEERAKNEGYEHNKYSRLKCTDEDNSRVLKDPVKTATFGIEGESDAQRDRKDFGSDRQDIVSARKNIIVSDRSNIGRGGQKIGCDQSNIESARQKIRSGRQKIGSGQKSIGKGRKNIGKDRSNTRSARSNTGNSRKDIRNDRKDVGKHRQDIGSERNTPIAGEGAKESKTKCKNSSTKISKGKSVQKFVQTKPNVKGMCVFAKNFVITSESTSKTGKKISLSKNENNLSKPRSATRLNDKKSSTKLPRKSCSACTVKTSPNDGGPRGTTKDIRSKSDTAACSKVREAIALQEAETGVPSLGRKSQSPVPIMLPSQSQLQNFDKVAKIKLRKTLAVKMRRHCCTGTWAFPPARTREDAKEREDEKERDE